MKIGFRERRRGIIEKILVERRAQVARMSASVPLWPSRKPGDGVVEALRRGASGPLKMVAEVGPVRDASHEAAVALSFGAATAGAAAIVVTAGRSLPLGGFATLSACRDALDEALGAGRPRLLCADFFLDPVQLGRAEDAGADGVILIARIVSTDALTRLVEAARERRLEPVIEIATSEEAALARSLGAQVIAVSGCDLRTMRVDASATTRLLETLDTGAVVLQRDGVATLGDLASVAATRVDAAVIGATVLAGAEP